MCEPMIFVIGQFQYHLSILSLYLEFKEYTFTNHDLTQIQVISQYTLPLHPMT